MPEEIDYKAAFVELYEFIDLVVGGDVTFSKTVRDAKNLLENHETAYNEA